jgi:hypothetical protein
MEVNYIAVLAATVAQFIFGAIWYMPIFGKIWGKIHDFDQVSPEKQKEMTKKMMPLLVVQFVFTFITSWVFLVIWNNFGGDMNIYAVAVYFWFGFILPTQAAAVIFGGTKPNWVVTKTAIMAGAGLINMLIAAFVFSKF